MTPKEKRIYKDKKEKPKDLYKDIPPGPDLDALSKSITAYLKYREEMKKPIPVAKPEPKPVVRTVDKDLAQWITQTKQQRLYRMLSLFNDNKFWTPEAKKDYLNLRKKREHKREYSRNYMKRTREEGDTNISVKMER